MLKKVDTLEERCPNEFNKYAKVLKLFDNVVKSCFGYELIENYQDAIQQFRIGYMNLNISVTPKVHAVMYHVEEFCSLTEKGLGAWSEQTSESLYHEFKRCWEKFLVKDTDNPADSDRLLSAVHVFNSLNVRLDFI